MDESSMLVTLDEYVSLERPNIQFIVDGLIPRPGLVLLLGKPGAGKSFLALQIALAVAQGKSVMGKATKQGKVLFFQFDMGEAAGKKRLQDLKNLDIDISGPVYTLHPDMLPTGVNIRDPKSYAVLANAIAEADPDLVIFDVLREMHNADEDSSSEMKIVGDLLMALVVNRAALILHHVRKIADGLEPNVIDASRGSSYLTGKVDSVWMLHDGYFYIGKSRFNIGGKYRTKRLASGLWALSI